MVFLLFYIQRKTVVNAIEINWNNTSSFQFTIHMPAYVWDWGHRVTCTAKSILYVFPILNRQNAPIVHLNAVSVTCLWGTPIVSRNICQNFETFVARGIVRSFQNRMFWYKWIIPWQADIAIFPIWIFQGNLLYFPQYCKRILSYSFKA